MSEQDLHDRVAEYLSSLVMPWARNNASGYKRHARGLTAPGIRGGAPDILIFPRGMHIVKVRTLDEVKVAVADLGMRFPEYDAMPLGIELKDTHRHSCTCKNCEAQREWAARMAPR